MDTLKNLQEKSLKIRERILKFENDLKQPLVIDLEDNAVEESSREILYSLYQVEKANLEKIEADIKELSSASFRDANI